MKPIYSRRVILAACALITLPSASARTQTAPASPSDITPRECLVIPPVGRSGRNAAHTDAIEARIVAGKWTPPVAGDTVTLPDGATRTWTTLSANKDGGFQSRALQGGYADFTIPSDRDKIMILEAVGQSMAYVNGEPRAGDPYSTGWAQFPIALHAGKNELLLPGARGELHVALIAPTAPALLNTRDMTLPDLRLGEKIDTWGAAIVLNATTQPLTGAKLEVHGKDLAQRTVLVPTIPPLGMRKVGFRIAGAAPSTAGTTDGELRLLLHTASTNSPETRAKFSLRVRKPFETYKRTFVSEIDGSVQYYAVNPAHPLTKERTARALFLSLHGASVEAIGQADAYESKTWGDIVCPTNRRPYGFDWEDWGRLDALEVLEQAKKTLHPDPRRIYLTGHSMGGHGTWSIGATYPDLFAAIGPSAGWISFYTYAGGQRPANPDPMQEMLLRGAANSDTLTLLANYAHEGVYILHGGADDNVPVTEAREMQQRLSAFHHDMVYYEQPGAGHWWDASDEPGADCVDWAPMFDFFSHHQLPAEEEVRQVEFVTDNPAVCAWSHWACVEAQTHALQPSVLHLRIDPGKRRFVGTTENIARLQIDLHILAPEGVLTVELDGQKLEALPYPTQMQRLWLARTGEKWAVVGPPEPTQKNPLRYGPFKQAFQHRMEFVYGTKGTAEENAWALAKARFDAETFWYRGNGALDVVPDTAFDPKQERNRSVILYGNADTNAAWSALLADSPVQVRRGNVAVGEKALQGTDLACLFLRPRPGSDIACVGVVAGSGLEGMRLTTRLPYLVSGPGFPDCLVLGSEMLEKGAAGLRVAGFFGLDWSVTGGDFAWSSP